MALSLRDDATTPYLYQNVPTVTMMGASTGTQAFSGAGRSKVCGFGLQKSTKAASGLCHDILASAPA
jgi:hypothetical protein